jgi:hypothetical protein
MDAAKIIQHNDQELKKREANRREGMKLKPLDKHYGQRYFQYDRSEVEKCAYCGNPRVLVANGTPVCNEHIKGSLG